METIEYPIEMNMVKDGKKFLYETGQWLNQRYGKFLGTPYMPDAVWAQTTGVTRTQMSMATLLAGLFPPRDTAMEWNRRLNWQPIPIFSEPLDDDSSYVYVDRPLIKTTEKLIKEFDFSTSLIGDSNSMTCVAKYPITWRPFKNFTGIHDITYTEIKENDYRFESTIHLINITQHYVGYFFCVERDEKFHDYSLTFMTELMLRLKDISGLSMVYLYTNVGGLVHTDVQKTIIIDKEYLVIPCKPTNQIDRMDA